MTLSRELAENYYYMGITTRSPVQKECPEKVSGICRKAIKIWEIMISELPKSKEVPQARMWSGYCYRLSGKYGKAIDCFKLIVDESPDFYAAYKAQYLIANYSNKMYRNKELSLEQAKSQIIKAGRDYEEKYPNSKLHSSVKKLADKYNKL